MTTYTATTTITITEKLMCSSSSSGGNTAVVCNNLPLSSPEPSCSQKNSSSPGSVSPKDLFEKFHASRRRLSESESDDSFIVFQDISPCKSTSNCNVYNFKRRSPQISESSSDDFIVFENGSKDTSFCYDTTTDDENDTDGSDTEHYSNADDTDAAYLPDQSKELQFKEKRVKFNLRPVVHEIRAWKFAYAQARKGHWHQIGWDRERFEMRINNLSQIVSPILVADHRHKIYVERFHGKL